VSDKSRDEYTTDGGISFDDFFCRGNTWHWSRKSDDNGAESHGRDGIVDCILCGQCRQLIDEWSKYRVWDLGDKRPKTVAMLA